MRATPVVAALCLVTAKAFSSPAPASTLLSPQGLGKAHVGMHLNAIANAMGNLDLFEVSGRIGAEHCYAIQSKVLDTTQGITFVGIDSAAMQRVDVRQPDDSQPESDMLLATQVHTGEGVKLGDPESRINAVYSGSKVFRPPVKLDPTYYVVELRQRPYGYGFVVSDSVVLELRSGHVAALRRRESCE